MYLQHRSEFDAFILGPDLVRVLGAHSCRQSSIRGAPSQAHRTEGPAGAPEAAQRRSADWQGQEENVRHHFGLSMVCERGSTWETRFFLAGVVSEAKSPAEDRATSTMHKIWQILLWSFGCLVKGAWPYARWTGRLFTEDYLPEAAKNAGLPLCGGYGLAVWQQSAELDYLSNYLELRR